MTRNEEILTLLDRGLSYTEISDLMGVSRGAVAGVAFRAANKEQPHRSPGWTHMEVIRMAKMLKLGCSQATIAEKLHRTFASVKRKLSHMTAKHGADWWKEVAGDPKPKVPDVERREHDNRICGEPGCRLARQPGRDRCAEHHRAWIIATAADKNTSRYNRVHQTNARSHA